ncbi:MAG: amino acid adenylation domain-containing protein [Leptolyngbya sp. SIOISBB]|nr:amino acid adenylation domain-containing protein [Leptolyngbya sp. SIOISBB]
MKTIEQFLSDLYQQEVQLWAEGDRLRCNAPEAVLTDDLSAQLQARKAEILAFLRQHEPTAPATMQPGPRTGPLPVSFAQQRLWFLEQMQQEGAVYNINIPLAIQVEGFLDETAFNRSFNDLIERHEALRTRFITIDGQPMQAVIAPEPITIEQRDLRSLASSEQATEVRQQAIAAAQTRFDLAQAPLLRVTQLQLAELESVVLLTMHHIIADGWSMEVLLQELAWLYRAHLTGADPALPTLPIQYGDFAVWQRQWLQGEVLERQLSYWREQLSGNLPVLQLPTDFPRARVQTFRGAVENFALSADLSDRLKALAQQQSTTLFVALLAAFKVLLFRYTGQRDLLVGTPIANRNRAEVEGLIGFFVNTLVLRSRLIPEATFLDVLEQLKVTTYQAYEHQDLPFEKLVEVLQPERDLSYNPLFQVKFRLENAPQSAISLPGLTLKPLPQAYSTAKLDLSVDLYETPDGIVGGFEYNRDLFEPETIRRMVAHFQTLLAGIAATPHQSIAELPLLTTAEQHQQLVEWNNTQMPYAHDRGFHHLFEAQAARTPDAIAVVFDDLEPQQLTYAELNHRSNQLAHHLQALGVGPEMIVGICLARSPDMIVALLAVLKAGGAYLPLDPTYPPERLSFMLADSQAAVLITTSALLATSQAVVGSAHPTVQMVDLTRDRADITAQPTHSPTPLLPYSPNALAYLIYTSGSTGTPKGVLVSHGGLTNLTEDKIRVCDVRSGDCVLQFFSFSFDACIPEIVMALATGARLLLAPNETLLPGPDLADLLRRHRVTHITITPSALVSVPYGDFPDLRMVLVGGEAPSPELINTWSQGRRFINAYGPTETTVNASMVPCGNGDPVHPTLRPSANKQLYVLDDQLQLLPVGAIGELHIGGVGLARGYRNRPALTAERFVPNPFTVEAYGGMPKAASWSHHPDLAQGVEPYAPTGQILYKTGDLACHLPDGRIKLLGRIDDQAKIRGFRVEPAEIENQLNQHPDVKASVVIVREDLPGDKRLVAYVVKAEGGRQKGIGNREQGLGNREQAEAESFEFSVLNSQFDTLQNSKLKTQNSSPHPPKPPLSQAPTPSLRQFLSERLPHYLVPSTFVPLDALPLTPNGKVDVRSLPAPALESPETTYVAPRNEVETALAEIFAQVLSVERVGIHDDFFELGGHSLLATQLVAQLLNRFAVEVTVIDLFEATTVAGLAQRLEQKQLLAQLQTRPVDDAADREEFAL